MPDGGTRSTQLLEQILLIEARGWTMASDGFWHHPRHTHPEKGLLISEVVALEQTTSTAPAEVPHP